MFPSITLFDGRLIFYLRYERHKTNYIMVYTAFYLLTSKRDEHRRFVPTLSREGDLFRITKMYSAIDFLHSNLFRNVQTKNMLTTFLLGCSTCLEITLARQYVYPIQQTL